jgi:hypothetical protein
MEIWCGVGGKFFFIQKVKILRNRRGLICHEKIAGEGMDMANLKRELAELRAEIIK